MQACRSLFCQTEIKRNLEPLTCTGKSQSIYISIYIIIITKTRNERSMQCLYIYIYDAPNACMLCSFSKSTCKHALAMSQPHGQHATCTCHCSRHCAALKSMLQNVFPLYTFQKATFKSKNALMLQEHAKI
jgi:hypothetical protein